MSTTGDPQHALTHAPEQAIVRLLGAVDQLSSWRSDADHDSVTADTWIGCHGTAVASCAARSAHSTSTPSGATQNCHLRATAAATIEVDPAAPKRVNFAAPGGQACLSHPCCSTSSAIARQLNSQLQLPRAARKKYKQLGILRAKSSLDGWVYGEGERTLLRQLDGGEDDAALLRVDFVRLRGVSAHQ